MKYEYWKVKKNDTWSWHLKAGNGQVVDQGGGYLSKWDMLHAIELVKLSRPAELNVRQSRRYRLSFGALLAVCTAVAFAWLAVVMEVRPRSDASLVTVDATVVHSERDKTARWGTYLTKIKFSVPDGRIFTPTIRNSNIYTVDTTVRIRYNPHDPMKVIEDSNSNSYFFVFVMFMGAGLFLCCAYVASLYDEERQLK